MGDRLTDEEFRARLEQELARPELVSFVARTKGGEPRRLVVRIWGEPRQATLTWSQGKNQTSQETIPATAFPGRAAEVAGWDFFEIATTVDEVHARRAKRAILLTRGKPSAVHAVARTHDRERDLVLDPGDPANHRLLRAIGLAGERGHVLPGRERKLRQVERFVRLVLESLGDRKGAIRILDAGCGAAYLTFALHHVLSRTWAVTLHGVDVREDVIAKAEAIARELGVGTSVRFTRATIREAALEAKPDVVLSLHACDTATDEALARGVELGASVILAAPCCQHELHKRLEAKALDPVFRHGILRERLADIATDGIRALILRSRGYKTDVVEFVEPEATMKNLMIRAVSTHAPREKRWLEELRELKAALGLVEPVALEALLEPSAQGTDEV